MRLSYLTLDEMYALEIYPRETLQDKKHRARNVNKQRAARETNMALAFKKAGVEPRDQHTYLLVRSLKRRVRRYHSHTWLADDWHIGCTARDDILNAHASHIRNLLQDLGGLAGTW